MAKNLQNIITTDEYLNANRHGEWLANNENSTGWKSTHKVHKSGGVYTRKTKHKPCYEH